MACILKNPTSGSKGILTFTTVEWNSWLKTSSSLYKEIQNLKSKWALGLHHNSAHADHRFVPDPLFDFHLAGPGDLKSLNGMPFYQIEIDCSNFCESFFEDRGEDGKKFWDLLFVSRNVNFKSVDDLFTLMRRIFDQGRKPRVLAILSHENLHKKGVGPSREIATYLRQFSVEERRFFTLMTPSIDYPFPFDLPTLAHFYLHSRAFLHVAHEERHPRVVAYAWSAGIPVIGRPQVASLLPREWQSPPGFFEFSNIDEGVRAIESVLDSPTTKADLRKYSEFHLAGFSKPRLKFEMKKLFEKHGWGSTADGRWFVENLDIRLARHHSGLSINGVPLFISNFARTLNSFDIRLVESTEDPENEMLKHLNQDGRVLADSTEFDRKVKQQVKIATLKKSLRPKSIALNARKLILGR